MIGIVKKVFVPKEYKNGIELDAIYSNKIGFVVLVENEEIEIIQIQNEFNCNIYRDDKVSVTKLDNGEYDIVLYEEG